MLVTQLFIAQGASTWNWPATVTSVTAECLGAGGGGGNGGGSPSTGGGGKGGSYAKATITKGAESSLTVNVGGGLSAGAGQVSSVVQSGTTVCLGAGGGAGVTASGSSINGAGGTTQNGTPVGTTLFAGGNGGTGNFTSGVAGSGGGGGAAGPTSAGGAASVNVAGSVGTGTFADGVVYQKLGAAGVGNSTNGNIGAQYGAGGSGAKQNSGAAKTGGAGGGGVVVLSWIGPDPVTAFIASTARAQSNAEFVNAGGVQTGHLSGAVGLNFCQTIKGHGGLLSQLNLFFFETNNPDGSLYIEIHQDTRTGTLLGTSQQVSISTIGTGTTNITFTFTPSVTLDVTKTYWMELFRTVSTTGQCYIVAIDSDSYPRGAMLNSAGAQYSTGLYDWRFELWLYPGWQVGQSAAPQEVTGVTIASIAALTSPAVALEQAVGGVSVASTLAMTVPTVVPVGAVDQAVTTSLLDSTVALFAVTLPSTSVEQNAGFVWVW